jgi:hemerythrin
MSFMVWSEALSVGLGSVDEQHGWLVDATNRLHAELARGTPDRQVTGNIIEGLMDYTMNHFIMEEALFLEHGYPEAAAHKTQHDAFTAKIMETLIRFEEGQEVGGETLDFLKQWLVEHIMRVDKAYAPFLAARGVT